MTADQVRALAAEHGHAVLAANDEGYIRHDDSHPRYLVLTVGVQRRPYDSLPFNCMDAASLRKWATTFTEAAQRLEEEA